MLNKQHFHNISDNNALQNFCKIFGGTNLLKNYSLPRRIPPLYTYKVNKIKVLLHFNFHISCIMELEIYTWAPNNTTLSTPHGQISLLYTWHGFNPHYSILFYSILFYSYLIIVNILQTNNLTIKRFDNQSK